MVALLSSVNLVLFVIQLFVNGLFSRNIGPMSRHYETLITPAPFAFRIWGLIYAFLAASVAVDCFWPSISFYESASNAKMLRALFAVACLMNMAWIVLFTNEYVNVATVTLMILWLSLFVLYSQIIADRRCIGFDLKKFVLSELGLTIYFAWTCAAMLISLAVTAQYVAGGYLSLTFYVALLSLLAVGALFAVIYEGDLAFGLVVIWALVGLALKNATFKAHVNVIALSIRACASQSAAVVATFIVISVLRKLLDIKAQFRVLHSGFPLFGNNPIDYGTTNA